jgi:hypothetical protein
VYNKLMNKHKRGSLADEQGFAALVIAIVLVIVLSLITVGFAQLMQSNQRSALDKQLSTQAYYAAETGINDAAKAINDGMTQFKNTCNSPASFTSTLSPTVASDLASTQVGNGTGAQYTCLLIDPDPLGLDYGSIPSIGTGSSKSVELTGITNDDSRTPTPIGSLLISWKSAESSGSDTFVPGADGNNFYPTSQWPASTPLLRISLVPLATGIVNRSSLISDNYVGFLYPNNDGSGSTLASLPSNPAENVGKTTGDIINGNCNLTNIDTDHNLPQYCNVHLTDLGQANYLLNMSSMYGDTRVTINAYDESGNQLRIGNAQTTVDSTGEAQDVLRRLQVRIPYHNNYTTPDGNETMSNICKQLQLYPASDTADTNTSNCTS